MNYLRIIIIAVPALYIGFHVIRFWQNVRAARVIIARSAKFERVKPDAKTRVLFLGDSTAYGTGAKDPENSTAGRLAKDFPEASIENRGRNGLRVAGLEKEFQPSAGENYDLIVIQIGANDILRFTKLSEVDKNLGILLERALGHTDKVILLHGGNMGAVPFFPWPMSWIYSHRTRQIRKIFIRAADEVGDQVKYVDLYTSINSFPREEGGEMTYCEDNLHPSDAGYGLWYQRIKERLDPD